MVIRYTINERKTDDNTIYDLISASFVAETRHIIIRYTELEKKIMRFKVDYKSYS